jgi:hypothetical protein
MVLSGLVWVLSWMGPWLWRMAIPPALPVLPPMAAPRPLSPGAAVGAAVDDARVAVEHAVNAAGHAVRDAVHALREAHAPHAPAPVPARRSAPKRPRRYRRGFLGRLAALAGGVLMLTGFATATLLAFDLPAMISAGVPDQGFTTHVKRDWFGGRVENWPEVMRSLMLVASEVLLLAALAALVVARRREGGLHILRAIAGVLGLAIALLPFHSEVARRRPWDGLLGVPEADRAGWPAVQALLECLRMPGAVMTVVLLVIALVVLAWPSRAARQPAAAGAEGVPA